MKHARWSIWLLRMSETPQLYFNSIPEKDAKECLFVAACKVFDGSDADALMLTRDDKTPTVY